MFSLDHHQPLLPPHQHPYANSVPVSVNPNSHQRRISHHYNDQPRHQSLNQATQVRVQTKLLLKKVKMTLLLRRVALPYRKSYRARLRVYERCLANEERKESNGVDS